MNILTPAAPSTRCGCVKSATSRHCRYSSKLRMRCGKCEGGPRAAHISAFSLIRASFPTVARDSLRSNGWIARLLQIHPPPPPNQPSALVRRSTSSLARRWKVPLARRSKPPLARRLKSPVTYGSKPSLSSPERGGGYGEALESKGRKRRGRRAASGDAERSWGKRARGTRSVGGGSPGSGSSSTTSAVVRPRYVCFVVFEAGGFCAYGSVMWVVLVGNSRSSFFADTAWHMSKNICFVMRNLYQMKLMT